MNIFNRLFCKKNKSQATAEPEPKQETKTTQENPVSESKTEQGPQPTKGPEPIVSKNPEKPAPPKPKKTAPVADALLVKETLPWRTFSIFISSTFADMQAERDHLKNVVFPQVEEELQKRRIKLEIVDLRWGVDTTTMEQEEEREANVLKVCLDEIKCCRPSSLGCWPSSSGLVQFQRINQ